MHYPRTLADLHAAEWQEIDARTANLLLSSIAPVTFRAGVTLTGEPLCRLTNRWVVYTVVASVDGRWWSRPGCLETWDPLGDIASVRCQVASEFFAA